MTHDYEKRVAQLQANRPLAECYPRLSEEVAWRRVDRRSLEDEYGHLKPDETYPDTLDPLVGTAIKGESRLWAGTDKMQEEFSR